MTFLHMNFVAHFGIKPVRVIWSIFPFPCVLRYWTPSHVSRLWTRYFWPILLRSPIIRVDLCPCDLVVHTQRFHRCDCSSHSAAFYRFTLHKTGLQFKRHYTRVNFPAQVGTRSWPEEEIASPILFYDVLFTFAWLCLYLLLMCQIFTCSVYWSGIYVR